VTKPGDPQKGKAAEAEQAEVEAKDAAEATSKEAAETKAEPKPKAKKPAAKKAPKAAKAEGTAAESTGVDKEGAEAAAVSEPEAKAKRSAAGGERSETAKAKKPAAKKPAAKKAAGEAGGERSETSVAEEAKPAAPAPAASRSRRRGRQPGEVVFVRAQAKYVRSSPRKARLVCDGIRGKTVAEARSILAFHPRSVSEAWSKLLESAVANAENNHDLVGEDLKIHAVFADAGPTIKRFRPRAMGRATRIRKRTSHLTIQLTPIETQAPASGTKKGGRK
jgi:ribosomal protein L22